MKGRIGGQTEGRKEMKEKGEKGKEGRRCMHERKREKIKGERKEERK